MARDMRHLTPLIYIDQVAKAGSIRRAAELLSITPSALNRRILTIEEELGVQIFERLPRGVRLNTAGEFLVYHIRNQVADFERVRSQIADLSGVRRGHVSIACSQALLPYFIPLMINRYRDQHPQVTFTVLLRDREEAERVLDDYSADLALVFEPPHPAEFENIVTVRQPVCAVMASDHPLTLKEDIRFSECLSYPLALPQNRYGVRALLETAVYRQNVSLDPILQSDSFEFLVNFVADSDVLTFQIPIGLKDKMMDGRVVSRQINIQDIPPGLLHLVQRKGRTLSVASARFADQLVRAFMDSYDCV